MNFQDCEFNLLTICLNFKMKKPKKEKKKKEKLKLTTVAGITGDFYCSTFRSFTGVLARIPAGIPTCIPAGASAGTGTCVHAGSRAGLNTGITGTGAGALTSIGARV